MPWQALRGLGQDRVSHCRERLVVVVREDQRLVGIRAQDEAVLDHMDLRDVGRVGRVDQHPSAEEDIGSVELLDGQRVLARLGEDPVDVVVLVDDHHRQVSTSGVGDGDGSPV